MEINHRDCNCKPLFHGHFDRMWSGGSCVCIGFKSSVDPHCEVSCDCLVSRSWCFLSNCASIELLRLLAARRITSSPNPFPEESDSKRDNSDPAFTRRIRSYLCFKSRVFLRENQPAGIHSRRFVWSVFPIDRTVISALDQLLAVCGNYSCLETSIRVSKGIRYEQRVQTDRVENGWVDKQLDSFDRR